MLLPICANYWNGLMASLIWTYCADVLTNFARCRFQCLPDFQDGLLLRLSSQRHFVCQIYDKSLP